MYNLILDSDALIKLTHSEVIFRLCETFNCLITNEIEEETVEEGKKRFYPDAFVIEKLIKDSLIKVKDTKIRPKSKEDLGKGEISVLQLRKNTKNCIIISDDSAFIKQLEQENIPFLVPSDAILLLKKLNKIDSKEAIQFLDKLRAFISEEAYKIAKKELMEG